MTWHDLVDLATFITAVIALLGFVYTSQRFRRQMNVNLFLAFTERYARVLDDYPGPDRKARLDPHGEPPPDTPELRKWALRYLNLCSEEYHLYQNGYLAKPVWKMWETKMRQTLRSQLFRRAWAQLADEFDDEHPEFCAYVRQLHGEAKQSMSGKP